ncbi:DUF222 domain-containing protein [Pseudonocardia sp. DSM 110487]|uniref:HNH endonuclease signature motif containing protein n=1 Tax=Pseudonocardia sp. DSM 110487 TaxID=2865833 RepID=UPI001C6A1C54|nr:DUF222 domain-containing protein [Pseudonocardia sp. DSM 110487]QYN39392.1 DUF222 domain-containing protein [Pseudonocardia sp. DSM 110487]
MLDEANGPIAQTQSILICRTTADSPSRTMIVRNRERIDHPNRPCHSNISSNKLEGVTETAPTLSSCTLSTDSPEPFFDEGETCAVTTNAMPRTSVDPPDTPLDSGAIIGWIGLLGEVRRDVSDAERIDQLRALERLKSAAAAVQARITVDLDASVRAAHAAAGVPADRQGWGVAAQVALARQESAYRGSRHLGLAKVLVGEMPHTLAALAQGALSEWRATLLARETACLSREHRELIDTQLCADTTALLGWGDRRLTGEIQKLAYRLDPAAVTRRRAKAESERRVTSRPAPDTMAQVSALLPVAQGVAVYAALRKAADTAIAAGDGRTRGQLMADILVQRVTGQATATGVPVEIHLIMSECTLLGDGEGSDQPAHLTENGPIPADLARRLAVAAAEAEAAWLRRLYATPDTGRLIAMDSTRRTFPAGLAKFIEVRDQYCRTPWCDAPIRHIDHAQPHHQDGVTSADNGNGTCAQCNYARQAPGWEIRPEPGPRHTLKVTTPTGHSYRGTALPPPDHPPTKQRRPGQRATTAQLRPSRRHRSVE